MTELLVIYDPAQELERSQRDALRGDWGVALVRTRLALRRAAPGADAVVLSAASSASWAPAFHDLGECAPSVPRLIIASLSFRPRRALLAAARQGDADALNQLAPLVYDELRRIAYRQMRHERQGHTLQPTALAHEAWARLLGSRHLDVRNRTHFMGIAAHAMREILVERARAHRAAKRGGAAHRVTLDEQFLPAGARPIEIDAAAFVSAVSA